MLYHGDNGNVYKRQELNLVRRFGVGTLSTRRQGGHWNIADLALHRPHINVYVYPEWKRKTTFIISPSEPLALMYYHKDVLKVIHYDESDILSLISSSVFLSFHLTSLYSIKKTHGTMLKMKKEHGFQK